MRKHFLILMLFALLPLAGFAEDLDMTKFTAVNIQYGATVLPTVNVADGDTPGVPLYAVTTDYTVSTVFYEDEALTISHPVDDLSTAGSGQYWLKITGQGTYAGQVYPLSFWIIGTDIATATIADVYTNNKVTYTGSAFEPKPTVTYGTGPGAVDLEEGVNFTYSYDNNKNAGTATITITGIGNYSGTATKNFTIEKADITAEMVTAPTAVPNLEYTGEPQVLVADGSVSGLAEGNAVTFVYKFDGDTYYVKDNAAVKKVNAGSNYVLTWKVSGNANYNDYTPDTSTDANANKVTGVIEKAILVARANAIETFYNSGVSTADIVISYEDFVAGETAGTAAGFSAPTKSFSTAVTTAAYAAGTYNGGIVLTGGSANNYEIVTVNNTLKINPAKLKLTLLKGKTATFGTDASKENEWKLNITDVDNNADEDEEVKLEVQNGETTFTQITTQADVKNYLTVVEDGPSVTNAGEITGLLIKAVDNTEGAVNTTGYALTLEGGTAVTNYTLDWDGAYVSDKKFVVTASALTIKADNKVKIYGEADPTSFTYSVTVGDPSVITEEMDAAIKGALTRVQGENAGNYIISFGETQPSFPGYEITYQTGKLVIQKATLTIAATAQSLYTGNTVADLTADDYTVTGLVTSENDATGTGINDEVSVELSFKPQYVQAEVADATEFAGGEFYTYNATTHIYTLATVYDAEATYYTFDATAVPVDADGKLTTGNVFDGGIKVSLINQAALSGNYKITLTDGILTVIDITTTLNLANNLNNNNAIEAANGTQVNVTFGARELKRETWTVMALPFETTVTEVSSKLGYAVVNIVDQSTSFTGNDLHLKLHMGKIEANQPFLVKYYKDNVPEVLFTDATAIDYNGHLEGNLTAGVDLTAAQATLYNDAIHPVIDKVAGNTLTPAEAAAYNATLPGAVNAGTVQFAEIDFSTLNLAGRTAVVTTLPYIAAIPAVVFYDKEIVSAEAKDEDPRGNIFYGVYAPTDVYGHEYATTTKAGVIKRLGAFTEDDPFTIVPTSGYFKMADAAARIFIEEPDGTTTVIKGINADGEAIVDNDGWYTLNGVKLQGAPTQKGIYINNGKKIVVK